MSIELQYIYNNTYFWVAFFVAKSLDLLYWISQTEAFQKFCLYMIWGYSWICTECNSVGGYLYYTYPWVKYSVDYKDWLVDQYAILTSRRKREPDANKWVSACSLLIDSNHYSEVYQLIANPHDTFTYEQAASFANGNIRSSDSSGVDSIIVVKNVDRYCVKLYPAISSGVASLSEADSFNLHPGINTFIPGKDIGQRVFLYPNGYKTRIDLKEPFLSSHGIMSCTYSHPKMSCEISIDIVDLCDFFVVGNQLFSPVFVRRLLEYQGGDFVFDMDYKITIIDNNVNILKLDRTKYLFIGVNGLAVGYL